MSLPGEIKRALNSVLQKFNMQLESLTAKRSESKRLQDLDKSGHFERAVFPVLAQFTACDARPLLEAVTRFRDSTNRFAARSSDCDYNFFNDYFTSPDAEVAYALVRQLRPKRIIEVGSGHSTRLFRAAINDGELDTELVSIDPKARTSVYGVADRINPVRLERVRQFEICSALNRNDVLFIDSSHQVGTGNDVVYLFLNIIPSLRPGVVIHVHDIFLPFDYPRRWIDELGFVWNEQYLVQAMMQGSDRYEVLWPGHYLQRTLPDFARFFETVPSGVACSLWLRKIT